MECFRSARECAVGLLCGASGKFANTSIEGAATVAFFEKVHQDLVIRGQTVDVKSLQQCFHACVKNDNSLRPGNSQPMSSGASHSIPCRRWQVRDSSDRSVCISQLL